MTISIPTEFIQQLCPPTILSDLAALHLLDSFASGNITESELPSDTYPAIDRVFDQLCSMDDTNNCFLQALKKVNASSYAIDKSQGLDKEHTYIILDHVMTEFRYRPICQKDETGFYAGTVAWKALAIWQNEKTINDTQETNTTELLCKPAVFQAFAHSSFYDSSDYLVLSPISTGLSNLLSRFRGYLTLDRVMKDAACPTSFIMRHILNAGYEGAYEGNRYLRYYSPSCRTGMSELLNLVFDHYDLDALYDASLSLYTSTSYPYIPLWATDKLPHRICNLRNTTHIQYFARNQLARKCNTTENDKISFRHILSFADVLENIDSKPYCHKDPSDNTYCLADYTENLAHFRETKEWTTKGCTSCMGKMVHDPNTYYFQLMFLGLWSRFPAYRGISTGLEPITTDFEPINSSLLNSTCGEDYYSHSVLPYAPRTNTLSYTRTSTTMVATTTRASTYPTTTRKQTTTAEGFFITATTKKSTTTTKKSTTTTKKPTSTTKKSTKTTKKVATTTRKAATTTKKATTTRKPSTTHKPTTSRKYATTRKSTTTTRK